MQPNTLKWFTDGLCPLQASSGVFTSRVVVGLLFITWTAQLTASADSYFGKFFSKSTHLTKFMMVRLHLSATPFCWGVYAIVSCLEMPCLMQNSSEHNSLPRYVLRVTISPLDSFSTTL